MPEPFLGSSKLLAVGTLSQRAAIDSMRAEAEVHDFSCECVGAFGGRSLGVYVADVHAIPKYREHTADEFRTHFAIVHTSSVAAPARFRMATSGR